MCLVEVGAKHPSFKPACATPAEEGAVITTDSPALETFRRTELQFLMARHPPECQKCEVAGACKLQDAIQEEQVEERWPYIERGDPGSSRLDDRSWCDHHGCHSLIDHSSPAIWRDMRKCIECGLCVDACGEQGQKLHCIGFADRSFGTLPVTAFDMPLGETGCISCGQCTLRCPVGALTERPDWQRVLSVLDARRVPTVVQTAPATRVAISEEFGLPPGSISTGKMVSALRALGFDYVWSPRCARSGLITSSTQISLRI
jgi:NADH-quinone oxidoreductase subunit G